MAPHPALQGGCLCGHVRYEVTGPPRDRCTCFCQSCRRASGAPSVAWFTVSVGDYRLLSGTPQAHRSSPLVTRTFCPTCGTTLSYQHDEPAAEIDLTTASLDEPDAAAPMAEIWVAHKLGWAASNEGLPQFAAERPARD